MKAFIFTGGSIRPDGITEAPEPGDLVICADAGLNNARLMGVTPSVLVGDFDSLGEPEGLPDSTEIIRVPAEKNDTDTQLAVQIALDRGARDLVIVGGLEGRLDHTLSSLGILECLSEKRIPAVFTSGQNRAHFIRNNGLILLRSVFRYFSVLSVDPILKGVTLEGCKYPLKNAKIERKIQYAVSNEIVGNCALVEIRKGAAYVIESRD